MHELSIALGMIEVASEEVIRRGNPRVHAVHLKIGELSGVVKDALLFSYEIASKDTLLEGSRLEIETVPVVIFCSQCQIEQTLTSLQLFACSICGRLSGDIRRGKELELVALELEEDQITEAVA
jgi:hydrogenase nickel incorporation protein HypA/HybF